MLKPKAPKALCSLCPLQARTYVPSQFPEGGVSTLAIVGEAPGNTEVIEGTPFVGPSGEILFGALEAVQRTRGNFLVTNVALCYPGKDNPPEAAIDCCKPRLLNELGWARTKYVLTCGATARNVLVAKGRDRAVGITLNRGRWMEGLEGLTILPTVHPAYVARSPSVPGRDFLFDIMKFDKHQPEPFLDTDTLFFHWPDKTAYRWARPDMVWRLKQDDREHLEWLSWKYETSESKEIAARLLRDVLDHIAYLKIQRFIAYDTETVSYDPIQGRLLNISFSWATSKASAISGLLLYHPQIVDALRELFTIPDIVWVAHNGKFDTEYLLAQIGTAPFLTEDTFIAHCALDERSQGQFHGLKVLVAQYFDVYDYEAETIKQYVPRKKHSFANIPPRALAMYAALDTDYTRRLWPKLFREMVDDGVLERPYRSLLMPATRAFAEIELHGVCIDWEQVDAVEKYLSGQVNQLLPRLRKITGYPEFNPNSPKQCRRVLWDDKGYKPIGGRKIKPGSTSQEVLKQLAVRHPKDEFIELLLGIRRLRKLLSSYVKNLRKYKDPQGRVHPVYYVGGTEVGRLSASDPAIQTIPRSYEPSGKLIKDMYVASPGHVLLVGDYSQAELRVWAILSQDPFLIQLYKEDRDLHTEVAIALYGSNFTQEQRAICKMFNFAFVYGGSVHSFAYDTGMDIKEAQGWVRQYSELIARGVAWKSEQMDFLMEHGYVMTATGRKRRFPVLLRSNRAEAKKAAVHAPIAGTAADLTLASLVKLHRAAPEDFYVLFSIHDSIGVEVPDDTNKIKEGARLIKTTMEQTAQDVLGKDIPFTAGVDIGYRWGSMLSYDGTDSWRAQVDARSFEARTDQFRQIEFWVCSGCGRYNKPAEVLGTKEVCKACKEER